MLISNKNSRILRLNLIVFLILVGIFIHPFPSGVVDFIFRFLIFAGVVFLLFHKKKRDHDREISKPTPISTKQQLERQDSYESSVATLEYLIANDNKLSDYLIKQFQILNGIVFSDNGYLLYLDQKNEVKVYYQKTIFESDFDTYPNSGLLQLVDKKNELLIENNLISDENLVNYNSVLNYTPGSFIGLPITIQGGGKLFFLFDAKEKQHFNPEDRDIVINIGDGISTFIANRLASYDLLERGKEGELLLSFSKELNGCATISAAIEALAVQISKYFEASRLTISTVRSETGKGIIKKVIGQQDEFMENKEFVLDEGLTGWVISKQKPYLIDDMEKGEYFIPRYSKSEKSNFGLRAFMGIPIVNDRLPYGAVTLEHQLPKKYSKSDQLKIEKFVDIFSSLYTRYRKQ